MEHGCQLTITQVTRGERKIDGSKKIDRSIGSVFGRGKGRFFLPRFGQN